MTATSGQNAWAVGYVDVQGNYRILIEHWNGSNWTRARRMGHPPAGSILTGVAATSVRNAWAVGYVAEFGTSLNPEAVFEHWNGTTWSLVRSKVRGSLSAIAAISAHNSWAVGDDVHGKILIAHWSGRSWKRDADVSPSSRGDLYAIAATSASNAWAVGETGPDIYNGQVLIEHWNGARWKQEPGPNLTAVGALTGVAATSASNAWAVGETLGDGALILHWNGDAWHQVRSPCTSHCRLYSVAITSRRDAWAVGQTARNKILILHWNGHNWKLAASENPKGARRDALNGVTARSAQTTWAVGRNGPATSPRTLIERWEQ